MRRLLVFVLLAAVLVGCEIVESTTEVTTADVPVPQVIHLMSVKNVTVYRFIDSDMDAVCWLSRYHDSIGGSGVGAGTGISCIPLADLELTP